jgi:TolB-like protein
MIAQSNYVSDYDAQMKKLALDVANQVRNKQKLNIAVWYFKDSFRNKTALGDYLAQEFSIYFTNISAGFEVMDRDAIEQVIDEHRLNDEGFIDPRTAKELGMYIQADAVVTGTVDIANSHSLKVRIKLIDIQTGKTLAAIPRNIPKDETMKYVLHETGINETKNIDEDKTRINRNERYSDPYYVDGDCEKYDTGDYCFENDTYKNYRVKLFLKGVDPRHNGLSEIMTIRSGQSACFTDLESKTYTFEIEQYYEGKWPTMRVPKYQSSLKVERCKSIVNKISNTLR